MSDLSLAELKNEEGLRLDEQGDIVGAESAYRAAMTADSDWAAPVYNLGLLCKYQGRWEESLAFNQRAVHLDNQHEAAWWNLGIAATALGNWTEARRAWTGCGLPTAAGDGPPEYQWGSTPVRLDPSGDAEVVWARRLDPARARIESIPLPTSRFRWGDVVLHDGAPAGARVVNNETYDVFDVLDRLVPSPFRTFVIELATSDPASLAALAQCAALHNGAAEDWGTTVRILCRACSLGTPHEHNDHTAPAAHPHCGLAARDHDHAHQIITAWLDRHPLADLITWYEAPRSLVE